MPLVKIMHIDPDYRVFLMVIDMVIDEGFSRVSHLPLREALELMKYQESRFDSIGTTKHGDFK